MRGLPERLFGQLNESDDMRLRGVLAIAVPLVLVVGANAGWRSASLAGPRSSSPIAVVGERLFVANPDSASISIVDLVTHAVDERVVGRNPRSVVPATDGSRLFVTLRDEGAIAVVDVAGGSAVQRVPIGLDPFGMIITNDGRLYVTLSGEGRVAVLDAATMQRIASIETEPHPRGLALSSDGSTLYVTHFRSGRLSVIDTASLEIVRVISTGADSNLSDSILLDETRGIAWLPQTRANASNPALLFDTTLFPIVSAIDLTLWSNDNRKRIALDIADRPVNMPSGAVLTAGGDLWIVNGGSDDVSVIDLATGRALAHIETGSHPRGIALSEDESKVFVTNALSGTVSIIDAAAKQVIEELRVTTIPLPPAILRGKVLFHASSSTALARDQWISCASCHPDGRDDSRTWFFRDGPRNTPTLIGAADTGPFHWSGDLDELEDVESTIRIVQAGHGLAPGAANCEPSCDQAPPNRLRASDLDALGDFLRSLRSLHRSPHLRDNGTLAPAALRGAAIFFSPVTGCAGCHPPPLFTDREKHDVGTGRASTAERKGTAFDTPSLRFLFATAPYLHDGSAATLRDVVSVANVGDVHGTTSHLDSDNLDDLVAFLQSIPHGTVKMRAVRRGR